MITFPEIPILKPGEAVSAAHLVAMANAINVRLLWGIGDGGWRLCWWMQAFARQIRNPSSDGYRFAPLNEAGEVALHLDPNKVTFPTAGPGEPEGINRASIAGAFVYGNEALDIDDEVTRLTNPKDGVDLLLPGEDTPAARAALAKLQRGAFDPRTGAVSCPAMTAARSHLWIRQNERSPHGMAWGGYMPTPAMLGTCGDDTIDREATRSYEIKFTNLKTGAVVTYPGTCPGEPDNVAFVVRWPEWYIVVLNNGHTDWYAVKEWLEGPYRSGTELRHTQGEHLPRILNFWAAQFRGTPDQKKAEEAGEETWTANSFDFRRFWATQYLLAPQRGIESGPVVKPQYARCVIPGINGYIRAGTYFKAPAGGFAAPVHEGCVGVHAWAVALALAEPCTIDAMVGKEVIGTLSLEPDAKKRGSAIVLFSRLVQAGEKIAFRVRDHVNFMKTGASLWVEFSELRPMRPETHDLYCVLRLSSCLPDADSGTDGYGLNEERARFLSDTYFASGCILNANDTVEPGYDPVAINTNAVWEAYRQMAREVVRFLPAQMFQGISLENGDTVLWFLDKYFTGDPWEGVYPILETAPPGGFTNEWALEIDLKAFSPGSTSIFRPEVLAYWASFSNRCLFYNPPFPSPPGDFIWNIGNGQKQWFAPEAPSGYIYATSASGYNLNNIICDPGDTDCETYRLNFRKSCQVYRAPYKVRKVEFVDGLAKVTLVGRIQSAPGAPASFGRDSSTWDYAALQAEVAAIRTDENGLREAARYYQVGNRCGGSTAPGNTYAGSTWASDVDAAAGSCLPSIRMFKLIEKPSLDRNDLQQKSDTPLRHDPLRKVEMYLRCVCEGWVDGRTSLDIGCESDVFAVFDFSFQNLMFQAAGQRWALMMPTAITKYNTEVREDAPEGFGPLPTLPVAAEVYNVLAKGVNELRRVRLPMVYSYESRALRGTAKTPVTASSDCRAHPVCNAGDLPQWSGTPPDAPANTADAWTEGGGLSSDTGSGFYSEIVGFNEDYQCIGTQWQVITSRTDSEVRWKLTAPDALESIPIAWRDMVATHASTLVKEETSVTHTILKATDDLGAGISTCVGGDPMESVGHYVIINQPAKTTSRCFLPIGATKVHAPAPPNTHMLFLADLVAGNYVAGGYGCGTTQVITPIDTAALIVTFPVVPQKRVT